MIQMRLLLIRFLFESLFQLLYYRQQRRAFILVSFVYFISDGVTARSHKKTQYHLRILVLTVFGEAWNADVVLLRFKIECTRVIKRHSHLSAHDRLRVFKRHSLHLPFHAYALIRSLTHLLRFFSTNMSQR